MWVHRMLNGVKWALVIALATVPVGCGEDQRLIDGGGGNILTAGSKVVGGQMTELTQDEMQVLSDQLLDLTLATHPEAIPPGYRASLTNEEADALLDFLRANSLPGAGEAGLNTIEEMLAFAEAAQADPSIVVVPQSLLDAFAYLQDADVNVDQSILFEIFGAGFQNLQNQLGSGSGENEDV